MNTIEQETWRRIEGYTFDEPGARLPFSVRLARDNGWNEDFTKRAIIEYKRFVFLAVTASHPVTPSDQVDQVWHQHLLYTETYWGEFCNHVLGKRLDHGPTRGGIAEGQKFENWYARTCESYERIFDAKPPVDLWPAAELRFGRDVHFQRVNTHESLVVPHPKRLWKVIRHTLHELKEGFQHAYSEMEAAKARKLREQQHTTSAPSVTPPSSLTPVVAPAPPQAGTPPLLAKVAPTAPPRSSTASQRTGTKSSSNSTFPREPSPPPSVDAGSSGCGVVSSSHSHTDSDSDGGGDSGSSGCGASGCGGGGCGGCGS